MLDPGNAWAYQQKGGYLNLLHRWDEALGVVDAGLAVNSNFAPLYSTRSTIEISLGNFEQAKSDILQAIRLSPRDPFLGWFYVNLGDAELGFGHFDAASAAYRKSIDLGFRTFAPYVDLASVYALEGKIDEAKVALAEARRLNPKLTVKWLQTVAPNLPPLFEGVRKLGLPEE